MVPLPSCLPANCSLHRIQGKLYTEFNSEPPNPRKKTSEASNGFPLDKIINLHHGLQSLTSFNLISFVTAVLAQAALGTKGVGAQSFPVRD